MLIRLAWEIGGAIAFGALVGALFALYLRYVGREATLMLMAVCVVAQPGWRGAAVEPLLAALAAGLVIENLAVAQGDALKTAVQRSAPPVLVIFFVAVGSPCASTLLRSACCTGHWRCASRAHPVWRERRRKCLRQPGDTARHAWTGLISQAGITLGLHRVVAAEFPGWGGQIQVMLVALIAIHELVGPCCSEAACRGPASLTPAQRDRSSSSRTASRTCTTAHEEGACARGSYGRRRGRS